MLSFLKTKIQGGYGRYSLKKKKRGGRWEKDREGIKGKGRKREEIRKREERGKREDMLERKGTGDREKKKKSKIKFGIG